MSTVPAAPEITPPPAKKAQAEPARPARRCEGHRTLAALSDSVRSAVGNCAGKALYSFALAQIQIHQRYSDAHEEAPVFDNAEVPQDARPWQTFENQVSDEPDKLVKPPITVATDVKMGLAILFVALADLANAVGKLPADAVDALAGVPAREACVVVLMRAAVGQMRHHLEADPLSRDLGYLGVFRQKFEALAAKKANVDPGAEAAARLFVDFVKVLAWHAATVAYEHERLTLNQGNFLAILAQLAGAVPAGAAGPARDALSFVREQLGAWELHVASARAQAKRARPAKKPARAPSKAAGPPAPPPRDAPRDARLQELDELEKDDTGEGTEDEGDEDA